MWQNLIVFSFCVILVAPRHISAQLPNAALISDDVELVSPVPQLTATSSQFVQRNYNRLAVAPLVDPLPLSAASAPLVAAPGHFVAAPLAAPSYAATAPLTYPLTSSVLPTFAATLPQLTAPLTAVPGVPHLVPAPARFTNIAPIPAPALVTPPLARLITPASLSLIRAAPLTATRLRHRYSSYTRPSFVTVRRYPVAVGSAYRAYRVL